MASKAPQKPGTARGEVKPTVQVNVVWRPHLGAQTRLVTCPYQEILYGGAKGGGKSDGLLGFWLGQYGRNPIWARGIIFRKSYPELEQLIARARELFVPLGAKWNENKKTWYFRGGATLKFRFLKNLKETAKYQGHEYTFIAFDEVGDVAEEQYINILRGALRSSKPIKERVLLLTGNPQGDGHKWLLRRFILAAPPEVPIVDKMTMADGRVQLWTRVFIPALLEDNPTLMKNDPGYEARLMQMCGGKLWLYRALRFGDWTGKREMPGALLSEADFDKHRVDRAPADLVKVVVGVDPTVKGYDKDLPQEEIDLQLGDACGIYAYGRSVEGHGFGLADRTTKGDPTVWSRRAVSTALEFGASEIAAEANNGGELVRIVINQAMEIMEVRGVRVVLVNATRGKYTRAEPGATDMKNGNWSIVGEQPEFEEEFTTWVPKKGAKSPNRIDAFSWAWIHATIGTGDLGMLDSYRRAASMLPQDQQDRITARRKLVAETMAKARAKVKK